MPSETPDAVNSDEQPNATRLSSGTADAVVVGRRTPLMNVLGAILFAGVLVVIVLAGDAGLIVYVFIPLVLLNLWASLVLFIRRPRAAIEEGVFSLRLLPSWCTPAANVANVELRGGQMAITFDDVQAVQPEQQRAALSRQFEKQGCHLLTGRGVFSLEQVNQLRATLGMPAQEHDRFADFEATLDRLTPRVIVTPALIAANVAVFLVMVLAGADVLQPKLQTMIEWGANYGPLTSNGQWWRLFSSMFMHFGVIHLLVNMWILRDIGREVERLVGNMGFIVAYLISGFFGGVASIFWHESSVSAGASGAIFGVFGILLGFAVMQKQSIPPEVLKDRRGVAIAFVVFNVLFGLGVPWIDQAAHIGGFLAGCLCGLVLGCDLNSATVQRKYRNLALVFTGATAAALAVTILPARAPGMASIGARIDEVDATAVAVCQKALAALESGEQTPTEVAEQITGTVVPAYVELDASLGETRPRNEEEKRLKARLAKYVELRRQGWELLAEAIENDDMLREGLAVEKFEAARAALANGKPGAAGMKALPPTDLRTEVALFSVAESRAFEKYARLMQQSLEGVLTDQELAEAIEREVLPVWRNGRERFVTKAQSLPPRDQPVVSRLKKYMDLQRDGWSLQVESLREQDAAKAEQSRKMLTSARQAAETMWQNPPGAGN